MSATVTQHIGVQIYPNQPASGCLMEKFKEYTQMGPGV